MSSKPIVTIWNKIDAVKEVDKKLFLLNEAKKSGPNVVVPVSALTGEGIQDIVPALESALLAAMEPVRQLLISYERSDFLDAIHRLGVIEKV